MLSFFFLHFRLRSAFLLLLLFHFIHTHFFYSNALVDCCCCFRISIRKVGTRNETRSVCCTLYYLVYAEAKVFCRCLSSILYMALVVVVYLLAVNFLCILFRTIAPHTITKLRKKIIYTLRINVRIPI